MVKELFSSERCLHFKTLHLNNSCNTNIYVQIYNLSFVGKVLTKEQCWKFISQASLHYLMIKKENKTFTLVQGEFTSWDQPDPTMLAAGGCMKRNTIWL